MPWCASATTCSPVTGGRRGSGVADLAPGTGLSEAGDRTAAASLDLDVIDAYADAVWATTAAWLSEVDLEVLDTVADVAAGLERAGVAEGEYPWLYTGCGRENPWRSTSPGRRSATATTTSARWST